MKYKAFLFDLNGTMIDDMPYHIQAWHHILNNLGAGITMERMKKECYGKNEELLERIFPGRFSDEEKKKLSLEKETEYQAAFRPHLQLIKGLDNVLEQAKSKGIKMAIGSAAIRSNIDFVVDGLQIRNYFDVLVSADDVKHSKPHPETYIQCAQKLGLAPDECLVFEDAPKGAESAELANMDCVVLTLLHQEAEFSAYPNIVSFIPDFDSFSL